MRIRGPYLPRLSSDSSNVAGPADRSLSPNSTNSENINVADDYTDDDYDETDNSNEEYSDEEHLDEEHLGEGHLDEEYLDEEHLNEGHLDDEHLDDEHLVDEDSDEDGAAHDPAQALHPIMCEKKSRTIHFQMRGTYTNWAPREAYRELVQNWRDAIIESNSLDPKDFCVRLEATFPGGSGKTEIVYKAFGRHVNNGAECLGFIRYIGEHGVGTIEISNLRATLHPDHLEFGSTTKRERQDQAGAHGKGLKLAIMVLMQSRQNHRVFCCSGGVDYVINFNDKGLFVARLYRNDKNEPCQQPKKSAISTPAVMPKEDVYFIIGETTKKKVDRNELGILVQRNLVKQADFESWSEVALDLIKAKVGDESIISTPHGDLLLSPAFHGNLYLKGLLLRESTESRSASLTGLPLGFGYNFAFGRTNRERQSLADADEETTGYGNILCHVLQDRPDLIGKICDILNSAEPRYAEAQCTARFWPEDTARMFKQNLLSGEFGNRWLYCKNERDQNPSLGQIVKSMGRQPFELTDKLWGILVQYGLVHTSEEEGRRRYENAPASQVPDTSFATSVHRLLRACLRACPQTSSMRVEFVDAGEICLDMYVSKTEPLTRLHKRWLCMDTAIAELGLVGDVLEAETVALTVKRLFADVLDRLPRETFCQQDNSRLPESLLKQEYHRTEQRLAKYQQIEAHCVDTDDADNPDCAVKWAINTSRQDDESMIELHFHQVSTCSDFRDEYFIAADVNLDKWHCPSYDEAVYSRSQDQANTAAPTTAKNHCQILRNVRQQDSGYLSGMEAGKEYFFAVVMPEDSRSFVKISNTIRVAARRNTRPKPSAIVPNGEPMATQSNGSRSPSPPPSSVPGPHNELQTHLDDIEEDEDSDMESAHDEYVSRSGPESRGLHNSVGPLGRSQDAVEESGTASGPHNHPQENSESGSFSLGPRLETTAVRLLELAVDRISWYEAENSDSVQAWIGIGKRGQTRMVPEESRKRLRMD